MAKRLLPACLAIMLWPVPGSVWAAEPAACPVLGSHPVHPARPSPGGFVTEGGSEFRLSGLLAADIGEEAFAFLRGFGPLRYTPIGKPDRYGRIAAALFAEERWLQGELLRSGLARVQLEPRDTPCAAALLSAETDGRNRRAGHWGDGGFAVLSPDLLKGQGGTFQIVEAKVVSARIVRRRAFLNFGTDYRTDFTVTVAPADMTAFRRGRFNFAALAGKRVRVRGIVDFYDGPEIAIAQPEAIELLD